MFWFLAAYVAVSALTHALRWVNLRHLAREGHRVPPELESVVDAARLERIADYTRARARFGMLTSVVRDVATIAFLFGGLLGAYDEAIAAVTSSFVGSGVLFFLGLSLASAVLEIPFSLYSSFRLEARYGFNRMTRRLFWSDWVKGTLLSLLLVSVVSSAALGLVLAAPNAWWLLVWLLLVGFSLLLTFLSPYLIEPLFYQMKPLREAALSEEVRALAERAGVHVGRVLEMDASKRSAHSNAYFTGIGKVKRVVLFDTLLSQMSHAEILAVLAHELGHWKKHHVLSRMLVSYALLLAGSYIAFASVRSDWLPLLVGLESASLPARLVVLAVLGSLIVFPLTPLFSYWSRRHEWQADDFAVRLAGRPHDLASALAKLASENLSNLHPHPLYAAFYYSHPPMAERIRKLRSLVPVPSSTASSLPR